MDLPSQNMYDTFKDEIWKELGPLDPDWFETLTAQTLTNEGNVSDQDELCANQEGNFKAPFDKSAAESQLFSTPKVFRHSRVGSPETEDEHSFTAEREKETLPWTATQSQSPCLFGTSKEGFQGPKHGSIQHQNEDSFDLLQSPQKSPVSFAKHISESLGAQIHPDISWTSSLNTPPAVPSTLILTKPDESPCPLTVSADKNVVFVRRLFPSLSNASRVGAMSPKSSDMPTAHKGVVSPVAGQNPESVVSPQSSLNQSEGVWRPKVPGAIEDGEICSAVASVLDGAEDVLSIFFTNSSSALRKVKTDRIKRKQIFPTKEPNCSSTDVSTANNAASDEQKTSDLDSGRHLSPPPVKTGDMGNTQWSPLSLSDIPPCTADSSCQDNGPATHVENSISTEQLQCDSGQHSRPHMKITDSGFTKKKRKFVYTIKTSKPQVQGMENQSQRMDSSPGIPDSGQNVNVKRLVKAPDEEECCSISKNEIQKQGNLTEENLPPSVQAKIQDLDISQLSRDFAQDFSQMAEPVTLRRVAEDTHRNGFSPSACLSAMKQANQKAGQANLAHDYDDVSNRRSVATTYQNYSINEGTIGDSGFQSAVADTIHVTASSFTVPSSENNGHSQQWTGFKTDIQRSTFTSTSKRSRKTQLDDDLQEAGTDADIPSRIEGSKTLDPGRKSELHMESTSNQLSSSARGTADNTNCFPLNGQLHGSQPKQTTVSLSSIHASGFKTASNKGIEISSANLERAKHLFEETEGERILSDQHIRCSHDTKHELSMSHGSVKDATFNSNQPPSSNEKSVDSSCQLTASQKADVTELCTLLEEADSQFDFTQFKTGELKQDKVTFHQNVDKELDPDFLTGIDFDDSFNSDLEKHLRVKDKKSLSLSRIDDEDASSPSKQICEGSQRVTSDENKNLYRAGHTDTSKLENNNPLMLGIGFKTAGGNVLRVSKKCLSKAKALFADLEENLMVNEKSPDKQSSETDAKTQHNCKMDKHTGSVLPHKQDGGKLSCSDRQVTGIRGEDATECPNNSKVGTAKCQSGFQMASGKGISISAKAIQEASAFFNDCDMMDTSAGVSVQHKKSTEPLSRVGVSFSHKKNLQKFKNVQGMKANFSKEPVNKVEDVNAWPTARHTEAEQHKMEIHNFGLKSTVALTSAASFHGNPSSAAKGLSSLSYKTSKNIGSSVVNELSASVGFSTARGEEVSVSADALKKAECLLNDIDILQDTNTQQKQKDGALGTGHLVNQIQGSPPKNGGFQTASGKGFTISSTALKRAKMLLSECGEVDDKTGVKPSHSEMPVPSPTPRNRGFLAASGKPMAFSSEALQKAKALFSDISSSAETPAVSHTMNGDKRQDKDKHMEKIHCGFSNAGGAQVHVSLDSTNAAALHGNPPLISMHPPLCQTSKNISCATKSELSNIGGFCTASGKKVSISDDAMTKAKSLFNENTTFEDTSKLLKQKVDSQPQQNGGFQTASSKGVVVSSAAPKKAKTLLSVCEGVEDQISVQPTCSKMTVPGPSGRSHGFVAASGKPMAITSEALEKAKALFSDISSGAEGPDVSNSRNSDKKQDKAESKEKIHCGFSTAGGAKVHVSPGNLLRAKNVLKEYDGSISATAMQEADALFMDGDIMDSGDGITASWKSASLSHDALTKSKSQFDENATFDKTNRSLTPKLETVPSQIGGFQTASGKGVAISSAALKKAKTLFSECEGVQDETDVKPTCSKMPVPGPPPRSHGFLAASGKPVAISSEALEKAKALFGDISSSTEIPAVSCRRNSEQKDAVNDKEKTHCGFATAGGAKVYVSQKNLLKAKNLLKDLTDGECHDLSPHDSHKSVVNDVRRTSDFPTASDKDIPMKDSATEEVKFLSSLQQFDPEIETFQNSSALGNILIEAKAPTDASKVKEGKMTNLHDSPQEEMAVVLDQEINQTSSSEGKQKEESSVLYCHSLNLTGCTETQRRFLAQEALDCTKALLEDESLSEQKLSMTSVNMPLQDNPKSFHGSVEEKKGKGKRLVEDPDMTGQPPLKRRLLEEFDRTVDSARGSMLEPQKSSPNGVMKDRRVFKYSGSLHPNITRPHRNGTNYVETRLQKTTPAQHSTPGDSISAHSKMSVFVPPFLKNLKMESLNHAVLRDNIKTPSTFVPPFKKQRTTVQDSSSKPHEEDKQHHLFVKPFKSNTYVPPTKNTQLSVTDNKSKEDLQMVTLADSTKDNLINNQNLPVGCETEESSTEASLLEDKLSQSQDMFENLHNVELARDMQDMRIRKKKRQTIRPLPGSLVLTKTSGVSRIPLKAAVNGKPPARYTQKQLYSRGLHQHVCEITSDTAECFRFSLKQFVKQETFIDGGGVQLADGGWLIPSNDGTAGKEEFYRALCDTPGVDPKLINEEWVYNHYRWIVWKQAAMERSFPETMGSLCLTPEQVLLQLKYRYDVEVDHSRRPALRKIMEKDDTAAKTLVLCVCGVISGGHSTKRQSGVKSPSGDVKVENQSGVVWLTDGWYGIKTQLDEPLTAMLQKGRLAVGGKLIISGAQLVGSQDACSPLEAPDSLMLKICANSSRPARWDAKLGFHRDPRPLLLPVSSLYSNGGPVGCVDIVILRSYPIQWMERKPDGGVVFRSVRAEEKEARRYNSHKQKAMESLFAKVQAEFEKEERGNTKPQRRRRTMSRQDIAGLQDGEELYEAVGHDPAYLEAHLSEQQLQTLHSYRRSLMEKKQAELQDRYRRALESAEDREGSCPKRDVTPVWRLCIADSMDQHGSVYQLNIWRPPSDLQSLLKEGCRYKVFYLTTSEGKKPVGCTSVQLTGTKKTQFQDLQASQEWLSTRFQPRFSTHFVALQNTDFQPLCGEVDLTGYVISIIDGKGFSPAFYLADGNLNFIKVRCFSSLAQSGLEDVVKPRVLLALSNLQLRGQSTSPTPVVFAGDLTVFSTNPKEVHLQESLSQLRNLIQGQANFSQTAEEKLSHLIKCDGLSSISSPALQTRTPASAPTTDRRQDTKTSVTSQQPVRSFGSFTPLSRNPPAQNCSTEKDPSSLKRRRALDYLSRIPSPPPLSNLGSVASPCVNKTFVPPRRSVTPSTLKTVQTPARKAVSSPVEEEWVNDEELAMIDTQALLVGDLM